MANIKIINLPTSNSLKAILLKLLPVVISLTHGTPSGLTLPHSSCRFNRNRCKGTKPSVHGQHPTSPSHLTTTTVWHPSTADTSVTSSLKYELPIWPYGPWHSPKHVIHIQKFHENFVTFAFCIFSHCFSSNTLSSLSRDYRPKCWEPRFQACLMRTPSSMVTASLAAEKNQGLVCLAGIFAIACLWLSRPVLYSAPPIPAGILRNPQE